MRSTPAKSVDSPQYPDATNWGMYSNAFHAPRKSPGSNSTFVTRYIVHRLLQGIVLLCLVATIVFFLGRLTGNPVDLMLPEDATAEDRVAMIKALGLDGPLYQQFLIFVGNALHGDLGMSIRMREPATNAFFSRLPNTLAIIPWAILLAMCVGIPLGVIAALNRGNMIDRIAGTVAVL